MMRLIVSIMVFIAGFGTAYALDYQSKLGRTNEAGDIAWISPLPAGLPERVSWAKDRPYSAAYHRHVADGIVNIASMHREAVTTNSIDLTAQLLMSEYAIAVNEVSDVPNAHLLVSSSNVVITVGTSTNLSRGEKFDFLNAAEKLRQIFGIDDLRMLPYGRTEIVTTNDVFYWDIDQ